MRRVVLDTNCLVSSLSYQSASYEVWKGLHEGKYILCVSNEILSEYQEILEQKTTPQIAENVIQFIINCEYVDFIDPYYHFELIKTDRDDNKFVDCAIAANATFIVTNDHHFKPLQQIDYPRLLVIGLMEFVTILRNL